MSPKQKKKIYVDSSHADLNILNPADVIATMPAVFEVLGICNLCHFHPILQANSILIISRQQHHHKDGETFLIGRNNLIDIIRVELISSRVMRAKVRGQEKQTAIMESEWYGRDKEITL